MLYIYYRVQGKSKVVGPQSKRWIETEIKNLAMAGIEALVQDESGNIKGSVYKKPDGTFDHHLEV
jgi:hypothetical protein